MTLDGCPLARLQTMKFLTGSHIPKTSTKISRIWFLNILLSQRDLNKCEFIWYFSICFIWFNLTTWLLFCGLLSTIYCFRLVVQLFTRSAHGISCKAFFLPEASFGLRVLSLPVSVCVCINHLLVRTITRHLFNLGSLIWSREAKHLG